MRSGPGTDYDVIESQETVNIDYNNNQIYKN